MKTVSTRTQEEREKLEKVLGYPVPPQMDIAMVSIEETVSPLYSPVKPEDVTVGYYWLVTPGTENTIERIWDGYGDGSLGMESPEGWVTVSEIYELGGVLYSIPELPEFEVSSDVCG